MNPDRSQMSPFPNIQENRTYSEQNSYYGHSILRRPQEESGGLSLYSKTKQNSWSSEKKRISCRKGAGNEASIDNLWKY